MNNINKEILTLWKTLTEREKEEVLHRLNEKLTPHICIEAKERAVIWAR